MSTRVEASGSSGHQASGKRRKSATAIRSGIMVSENGSQFCIGVRLWPIHPQHDGVSKFKNPEQLTMFGSKRKRAVRAAVENTRHLVDTFELNAELLDGFWENDYVVGFVGLLIANYMETASDGKLSVRDKRRGWTDALTELSKYNGEKIAVQFRALLGSHNSDFKLAVDRALIWYSYVSEELDDEDAYPDLVTIKAECDEEGLGNSRDVIAHDLLQRWFFDVVRSQLSLT